jgi:hypothetical protein
MKGNMENASVRDAGDIIDRLCIAQLKSERIGTDDNHKEYLAFSQSFSELKEKHPKIEWDMFRDLLFHIHDAIWQFEAGSKSGKERLPDPHYIYNPENKEVLSTIGLIGIEIRNYNSLRVKVKNILNKMVHEGYMDIKVNHISEG